MSPVREIMLFFSLYLCLMHLTQDPQGMKHSTFQYNTVWKEVFCIHTAQYGGHEIHVVLEMQVALGMGLVWWAVVFLIVLSDYEFK